MSMGDVKAALAALPEDERAELIKLLEQLDRATKGKVERENFASFRSLMYPDYVDGAHLRIMADAFQRVAEGKLKRLIVTLPPRHMKSVQCSVLFPAWFIGRYPKKKIMQVSNTAELAQGFGRQVKNMIQSREYKDVFPDVKLAADSTAAGRWNTNKNGEYYAVGMGGSLAGRGADILVIDDPHCLEINTEIPTPLGFVKMKDLKVGDFVFGPDGKPTEILWKSEPIEKELYEVRTSDGEVIKTDDGHLWTVRTQLEKRKKYKTIKTSDLVELTQKAGHYLPPVSPVEYKEKFLPIDPWILGAWLGDGTSSLGRMTSSPEDAPHMRGMFEARGYKTTDQACKYSFGVLGMRRELIQNNLLNNKHIPSEYFTASPKQRLDLLRGLMDTDGNVNENGSCFFDNQNKKLVDGVVEIVRSLGVKCSFSSHMEKNRYGAPPKETYRAAFKMVDCFTLKRKLERCRPLSRPGRSISVKKTQDVGFVQCIRVARNDSLFLAGRGYVVTHNCEAEALAAEAGDQSVYDKAYHWYMLARQRLQPGGAIIICVTRWSQRDLVAQILKAEKERGESEWEVIDFPAILPSGKQLWPEFWSLKELNAVKDELPIHRWSAQYQQNPVSIGAALIKSNWWRKWDIDERGKLPEMEYIIQSWDTATTANTRSNFSACTTWGMFYARGPGGKDYPQFILLDAFRARLEFPDLKQKAKELNAKFKPDALLIENTAQGTSLIPELRLAGLPVTPFNPGRVKNDKILRVNGVSDIFKSGQIWYVPSKQADEVIAQFEAFPNSGDGDDYVDSCTQAIATARAGGVIRLERDEDWTEDSQSKPGNRYYSVF